MPRTAPTGMAINATTRTSAATISLTWRRVAPTARSNEKSRCRPRRASPTVDVTTSIAASNTVPPKDPAKAVNIPVSSCPVSPV